MKKTLLFILLVNITICVEAQTDTYFIDWSFGSNSSASGDANADRTIEVGDTVTWVWYANGTHNVVSNSNATDSFASELLGPGSEFSYTFTQVGDNDYVCTLHSGSMFGTITVVPDGTLSTENFTSFEDIKFSPNPATNQLNINFEGVIGRNIEVEIFNALGQHVKTFGSETELNMSFDISEFNSGLYLVKISQGKSSVTKRLVVQ